MDYRAVLKWPKGVHSGAIYELVDASELKHKERRLIASLRMFSYCAYISAVLLSIFTVGGMLSGADLDRSGLFIDALYIAVLIYVARGSRRGSDVRATAARMRVLLAKAHRFAYERRLKRTGLDRDGDFDRLSARVSILCERESITTPGFVALLKLYLELVDTECTQDEISELDAMARQALARPAGSRIRQALFLEGGRPSAAVAAECKPDGYESHESPTRAEGGRPV